MVTIAPSSGPEFVLQSPFPLYLLIALIDKSHCAKSMLTSWCWVHWHKLDDGSYSSGDKAVFRLVVQVFNIWYLFPDKLRSSRVGYRPGQGVQLQLTFVADFPTQGRSFLFSPVRLVNCTVQCLTKETLNHSSVEIFKQPACFNVVGEKSLCWALFTKWQAFNACGKSLVM